MAAAAALQCAACLSFDLSLVGGALVCDVCGTRSTAFIEEATEYAATDGGRLVRRVRTGGGQAAPALAAALAAADAAAASRPPAAAFVLANVRCMQRVLMVSAYKERVEKGFFFFSLFSNFLSRSCLTSFSLPQKRRKRLRWPPPCPRARPSPRSSP
jgi:hypothetical protein